MGFAGRRLMKPSFSITQRKPAAASRLSGNQSDKLQGFGDSVPKIPIRALQVWVMCVSNQLRRI